MKKALFLAGIFVLALLSCAKKAPPRPSPLVVAPSPTITSSASPDAAWPAYFPFWGKAKADMTLQNLVPRPGALKANAHAKYLSDPLSFQPFDDQGVKAEKTAVVGSRVCRFYPGASVSSTADLAALPAGISVPFGTILPIYGEELRNADTGDRVGMFEFQKNWNWFYRTKYQGKDGLVFGADLMGLSDGPEVNKVSAELYRTGGRFDAFHAATGYRPLSEAVTARLEKERLAFQSVSQDEYHLYDSRPDDMLSLYLKHRDTDGSRDEWKRKVPVFISTDLISHAQHLMFDRLLQYLEEAALTPRLKDLNQAFLATLKAREGGASAYQETHEKALLYFQVAQALLDLAPERVFRFGEWEEKEYFYQEKNAEAVLAAYPQAVRDEVAKMDRAAGFEESSVFTFADGTVMKEDYSQYKPRGHYTKNGVLSAYFRAMMWFGRIHFLIAQAGPEPLSPLDGGALSSDSIELTLAMEPIALYLTEIVRQEPGLYDAWGRLFDPITALIGLSDDLSFQDVLPLWKGQGVKDFGAWASSKEKLLAFMRLAHEKLRPPAISGSSVFYGPSEGPELKPPMGWRLFGQRFTWDSAVHQELSPPRFMPRDMVRGLDIMAAFGSRTADELLASSDYTNMKGLEKLVGGFRERFAAEPASFWNATYYSQILGTIRAQALFEPGAGFYFTESPAWGTKAMLSSHATWAELRHDTILYVKQVYAERAGDGDYEPTFRTEPLPEPVHYIEPNLAFWEQSILSVQCLAKTLEDFDLLDADTAEALSRLHALLVRAAGIVRLEIEDKPVSAADLRWIPSIPAELAPLVLIHTAEDEQRGNSGAIDQDLMRMALMADVYTNAEMGMVLETAVGIPHRIYVPLNDGQGGKRIAVGYCHSYYEFSQPMDDRLTDKAWKAKVYTKGVDLSVYQPFWAKGIALGAEAKK